MSDQAPPPPAATQTTQKPSGGRRALAIVGVIVLLLASALMIAVAVDINGTPTKAEVLAGEPLNDGSYYDGSEGKRTAGVIMLGVAGVLGLIASVALVGWIASGRRGELVFKLVGAALLIGVIAFVIF